METGTIKWFNFTNGYGFIEPSDKSRDAFLKILKQNESGDEIS